MRPSLQLDDTFFDRPSTELAVALLGKVIRHAVYFENRRYWLAARIIETEAYALTDRGSHASLGYTPKRAALFMQAGTIYMYYAHGGDSLNVSASGEGNAVLIKSAYPYFDAQSPTSNLRIMQANNPLRGAPRPVAKLCCGQTLLCRSLALRVKEWDQQSFDPARFYFDDVGYAPAAWAQCRRLGIPEGRDEHLPWRFVDTTYARVCTRNPLTARQPDFTLHERP